MSCGLIMRRLAYNFLFAATCWALHEDEVGQYEWLMQQLGEPTLMEYSIDPSNTKRLFVATAAGTVSSVFIKDGTIEWRRIAAPNCKVRVMRMTGRTQLTVTDTNLVQLWKTSTGALTWQQQYMTPVTDALIVSYGPQLVKQDMVILQDNSIEARALQGQLLWTTGRAHPEYGDVRYIALTQGSGAGHVCVLAVTMKGNKALSIHVDLGSGKVEKRLVLKPEFGAHIAAGKPFLLAGTQVVILTEKSVAVHALDTDASDSFAFEKLGKDAPKGPLQFMRSWASSPGPFAITNGYSTMVFTWEKSKVKHLKVLSGIAAIGPVYSAKEEDVLSKLIAIATLTERNSEIQLLDPANSQLHPVTGSEKYAGSNHGHATMVMVREAHSGERRALLSAADHSMAAIQAGTLLWIREEALASITQAAFWMDAPVATTKTPKEPKSQIAKISEAITLSVTAAPQLVADLVSKPVEIVSFIAEKLDSLGKMNKQKKGTGANATVSAKIPGSEKDLRDFGADKIIIAATKANKLFALQATTSMVIWQQYYGSTTGFAKECESSDTKTLGDMLSKHEIGGCNVWIKMIPTSSAAYSELLVVLKEAKGPKFMWVDPGTGRVLHEEGPPSSSPVVSLIPLPQAETGPVLPFLLVDGAQKVHVMPKSSKVGADILAGRADRLFHFEVNKQLQAVMGYAMGQPAQGISPLMPLWNVELSSVDEKIIAATTPAHREWESVPVHIKGDASILYKYINPNMVVVVSESKTKSDGTGEESLNMYAINAVTGHILHHSRIADAVGPVHLAACDNWATFHYFNKKKTRFELFVVEFFEAKSDDGPWNIVFGVHNNTKSAHHLESPIPLQQTYIFPAGITAMGVTATLKGITPRSVIMALTTDHILRASKDTLNPRRPMTGPTPADRETLKSIPTQFQPTKDEMIQPYAPVLALKQTDVLTHTHSVGGVTGIVSSPTNLESTSIVFTYGLDLFFTPVQTAKAYDVLPPGFDYKILFLSCAVVVGSVIGTSYLANIRALQDKWK